MDLHLLLSLGIPAVILIATGGIKSLVRSSLTWGNFYLGLDVTLAAVASGLVNFADIVRDIDKQADHAIGAELGSRIFFTLVYVVAAGGALLVVMLIHQRWDRVETVYAERRKRGVWLGIVSNAIGFGLLLAFIELRMKGRV